MFGQLKLKNYEVDWKSKNWKAIKTVSQRNAFWITSELINLLIKFFSEKLVIMKPRMFLIKPIICAVCPRRKKHIPFLCKVRSTLKEGWFLFWFSRIFFSFKTRSSERVFTTKKNCFDYNNIEFWWKQLSQFILNPPEL